MSSFKTAVSSTWGRVTKKNFLFNVLTLKYYLVFMAFNIILFFFLLSYFFSLTIAKLLLLFLNLISFVFSVSQSFFQFSYQTFLLNEKCPWTYHKQCFLLYDWFWMASFGTYYKGKQPPHLIAKTSLEVPKKCWYTVVYQLY